MEKRNEKKFVFFWRLEMNVKHLIYFKCKTFNLWIKSILVSIVCWSSWFGSDGKTEPDGVILIHLMV